MATPAIDLDPGVTEVFEAYPVNDFDTTAVLSISGITVRFDDRLLYVTPSGSIDKEFRLLASKDDDSAFGSTDEWSVSIRDAKVDVTDSGSPLLMVTYEFTNLGNDGGLSFSSAVKAMAFHDGVECERNHFSDLNYNITTSVLPDKPIAVDVAYELSNLNGDIEIRVYSSPYKDDVLCQQTYSFGIAE